MVNWHTRRVLSKIHRNFRHFSKVFSKYLNKDKRSGLKASGHVYVDNPETANCIAQHISEEWKHGYFMEANPGPGILTRFLLQNRIKPLRVFERNKEFLPALKDLSTLYPTLEIIQDDFMLLRHGKRFIDSKTSCDLDCFETYFHGIPEYPWENGVPFQVFSVIASKGSIKFLRYLLAVLPLKSSIFSFGRCEFFLLLKEREYTCMTAVAMENFSTYRWSTVLYNLFFEIKCLEKFSSESLSAIYSNKKVQNFYLIKLTPRADLFSDPVTRDKLTDLYFFVRHHMARRSALVIPTMECWIPLCGPRLIKEGINVFTKFGDLSPNQILLLFKQFSSWPEYEGSNFHAAAEAGNYYTKFSHEDDNLVE